MKHLIAFFIIGILLSFGCKKADKLTQFDMEYTEQITVPATISINLPFDILTPPIETNSESVFEINDTRKDLIEEIILKELELTISSPFDSDFSFLKSINIFISADGLSEIKIAWLEDIPSNVGNHIVLETTNNDLKDYIKEDSFNLKVNTVTDEILTSDHVIDLFALFFVDAEILGI